MINVGSCIFIKTNDFPSIIDNINYCHTCDQEYQDIFNYCSVCGTKLEEKEVEIKFGYVRYNKFVNTINDKIKELDLNLNIDKNITSNVIYIRRYIPITNASDMDNIINILDVDTSFDETLFKDLLEWLDSIDIKYEKVFGIIR